MSFNAVKDRKMCENDVHVHTLETFKYHPSKLDSFHIFCKEQSTNFNFRNILRVMKTHIKIPMCSLAEALLTHLTMFYEREPDCNQDSGFEP